MKSFYILFFFAITIIAIVIVLNNICQIQFDHSQKIKELQTEKSNKMQRDSIELFTENTKISEMSVTTERNELIKLKSRIVKPTLVYRFSNQSCRFCVENDLKILNILAQSIGESKIVIITKFENIKFLKIYLKNEKILFDCYNFNGCLVLPIERNWVSESPYFFVLNSDLKIDFAYISNPKHSINSLYFKRMVSFLSE